MVGCNSTEPQNTLTTTLGAIKIEDQGKEIIASPENLLNTEVIMGSSAPPKLSFSLGGNDNKNSGLNNLNFGIRDSESGGARIEFSVSELYIGQNSSSVNESTNYKLWATRPNGDYAKVSVINKNGYEGSSNANEGGEYKIDRYFSVNGNVVTFFPNSMILDLEINDPKFSEVIEKVKRFTVYFQVDGQMISPSGSLVSPFQFSLLKK
jgi:hypothetical protein